MRAGGRECDQEAEDGDQEEAGEHRLHHDVLSVLLTETQSNLTVASPLSGLCLSVKKED